MRSLRLLPISALLLLPASTLAADNDSFCISQDFYARISQYYNLAIAFAILAAIFMLVAGGYRLVVSIGKPALIESGKKMIYNAIIGLSIAVTSAVILNILNPRILNQNGEECKKTSAVMQYNMGELA